VIEYLNFKPSHAEGRERFTIEDSKDTDASLTTLTRNLGEVVGASLHSMAVTRDAIFGGKVPK